VVIMSRIIRKVEDEDWYIVYYNTVDKIIPIMFENEEIANIFIEEYDKIPSTNLSYFIIQNHQGVLTLDDFNNYKDYIKNKSKKGGNNENN